MASRKKNAENLAFPVLNLDARRDVIQGADFLEVVQLVRAADDPIPEGEEGCDPPPGGAFAWVCTWKARCGTTLVPKERRQ